LTIQYFAVMKAKTMQLKKYSNKSSCTGLAFFTPK